jgi:hypothetical protein
VAVWGVGRGIIAEPQTPAAGIIAIAILLEGRDSESMRSFGLVSSSN